MTKEEFASMINGRRVDHEITGAEERAAREAGLLVVFGASDDLIELRGAITDEVYAYEGGECYIKDGKLIPDLDDETEIEVLQKHGVLEIVQKMHKNAIEIEAKWCPSGWEISASVDYAMFEISEGDTPFCRGIVINL